MNSRGLALSIFAFITLLLSTAAFAQDAGTPTKVCVAAPTGPQAQNWKLHDPIVRKLTELSAQQSSKLTVEKLSAGDEKPAKKEAKEKSCAYLVLPFWEENRGHMQTSMNPDPHAKTNVDLSASSAANGYDLHYKLLDGNGKKIATNKTSLGLPEHPVAADYQAAGTRVIDFIATDVMKNITK